MENSSPTNSGPDSEAAYSVDDLPSEERKEVEPVYTAEDLTNKVAAATSYVGSFFNPSSWKNPSAEKSPEDPEENAAASAGSSISSSLFSAIGKVPGFTKVSPTEETVKEELAGGGDCGEGDKTEDQTSAGTAGGFFSAFSKIGISGMSSSATVENISANDEEGENDDKKKETWGTSLSQAFNKVGKVATDYSKGRYYYFTRL